MAKPDGGALRAWVARQGSSEASVISRVEAFGFVAITPGEERALDAAFETVVVLDVTTAVIDCAIFLRRQRRMTLGDSLIAATALMHNVPLATRNLQDFRGIAGLALHDPLST